MYHQMKSIARLHTPFPMKFGIPKQSGLIPEIESLLVFEPEYRNEEALRGITGYSHLWLIWLFSEQKDMPWRPCVRPPRLGGNEKMGVFATRSPFRPNALGLSCVTLKAVEHHSEFGIVLRLGGADLLNGTPIFDIKPYLPQIEAHPNAKAGFSQSRERGNLDVVFLNNTKAMLAGNERVIEKIIAQDPRPAYHHDEKRVYGFVFDRYEVRFTVCEQIAFVQEIIML